MLGGTKSFSNLPGLAPARSEDGGGGLFGESDEKSEELYERGRLTARSRPIRDGAGNQKFPAVGIFYWGLVSPDGFPVYAPVVSESMRFASIDSSSDSAGAAFTSSVAAWTDDGHEYRQDTTRSKAGRTDIRKSDGLENVHRHDNGNPRKDDGYWNRVAGQNDPVEQEMVGFAAEAIDSVSVLALPL